MKLRIDSIADAIVLLKLGLAEVMLNPEEGFCHREKTINAIKYLQTQKTTLESIR